MRKQTCIRQRARHEHQFRQGTWHPRKALGFRSQRAEVLANNIANADTPTTRPVISTSAACSPSSRRKARVVSVSLGPATGISPPRDWKSPMRPCVSARRPIRHWTRTPSICRSSNPTTRRTPSISRRALPCSTASSGADQRPARNKGVLTMSLSSVFNIAGSGMSARALA